MSKFYQANETEKLAEIKEEIKTSFLFQVKAKCLVFYRDQPNGERIGVLQPGQVVNVVDTFENWYCFDGYGWQQDIFFERV